MYRNPALDLQAKGYRLRIPKDGSQPESVETVRCPPGCGCAERVPISHDDAREAISGHLLTRLTEHRNGARMGWRELDLDGDVADWYVWMQ